MYKLTGSEKCTEVEMNDRVTIPNIVYAAKVSTKTLEGCAKVWVE